MDTPPHPPGGGRGGGGECVGPRKVPTCSECGLTGPVCDAIHARPPHEDQIQEGAPMRSQKHLEQVHTKHAGWTRKSLAGCLGGGGGGGAKKALQTQSHGGAIPPRDTPALRSSPSPLLLQRTQRPRTQTGIHHHGRASASSP